MVFRCSSWPVICLFLRLEKAHGTSKSRFRDSWRSLAQITNWDKTDESNDIGAELGASGISGPAPKVDDTLASKAADGVTIPMEAKKGFKLTEVAQNTLIMPGGFYRGSFAVIMNQEKFDSLSAKDQKALNGVFGLPLSSMAGQVWDSIDGDGFNVTKAASDNSINFASSIEQAKFEKIAEEVVSKVLKEVSAKGVDGKSAQAFIAAEMAKF